MHRGWSAETLSRYKDWSLVYMLNVRPTSFVKGHWSWHALSLCYTQCTRYLWGHDVIPYGHRVNYSASVFCERVLRVSPSSQIYSPYSDWQMVIVKVCIPPLAERHCNRDSKPECLNCCYNRDTGKLCDMYLHCNIWAAYFVCLWMGQNAD